MGIHDPNRIYDGWISLEGGVDAGRSSTLLDANQCVSSENMVFRGGHPTTRPGWRNLSRIFLNPEHEYYGPDAVAPHYEGEDAGETVNVGPTAEDTFKTGIMQCAIGYSPHHGDDCLMAMVSGRLFKILPGSAEAKITEIVLPYRNTNKRQIAYMQQADKWLIAQDGQSLPILYDGNIARRADSNNTDREKTEVPVGTIMAYGMGRLVVIVNERDVAFGDLYGSHDKPDPADSLIQFTERNFLTGGFDAAIPFQQGVATGAAFFPQLDTSTGTGQLMVFSERGASAFFLNLPRELWQTSQFQLQALVTTGLRGHRSIAVVNEDLWFRAEDGQRTYRQARSEPSGWAHIPLSTNVKQFMDSDSQTMLKFASSIYFDNRVITTVSPYWNQGRPHHQGAVVVDFDVLSAFGVKYNPAWDGHWQNYAADVKITQLVTGRFKGVTRAFIFAIDENDENQIYELTMNDRDDFNGHIEWELISRSFDFSKLSQQGNPFTESELYDADIWLRDIIE